jgi:hypothetical protein
MFCNVWKDDKTFLAYVFTECLEWLNLLTLKGSFVKLGYGGRPPLGSKPGVGELFLGITPEYICVQRYYPIDLKVRKNELIAFKIVAYAIL